MIDSLFTDQVEMSTLRALARINPYDKYSPSTLDKILEVGLPAAKLLYSSKDAVDFENKLKPVLEAPLSESDISTYDSMLFAIKDTVK